MISVGIDVAKGKSMVCILKPYGEIVSKPFDISHVEKDLGKLAAMLLRFDDEVKVVMEATGIYHLPVLTYLQEKGLFVAVINPYLMKVYRSGDLRKAKTDKIDSRIIANYGIEHWFSMAEFKASGDVYGELKMLGQQYRHYMKLHIMSLHELTHLLDYTMPGIKGMQGQFLLISIQQSILTGKLPESGCHVMLIKTGKVTTGFEIFCQVVYGMQEYLLHVNHCIIVAIASQYSGDLAFRNTQERLSLRHLQTVIQDSSIHTLFHPAQSRTGNTRTVEDALDCTVPDRVILIAFNRELFAGFLADCTRKGVPMAVGEHKIPETGYCNSQEIKDKKNYSVLEIADILQISKSKAYELCKQPNFKVVRLGRRIRISKASFDDWLNNLL